MNYCARTVPTVEALTFQEFVDYGLAHTDNMVKGMPRHFEYKGVIAKHENDQCYLLTNGPQGFLCFTQDDMLVTDNNVTFPLNKSVFHKIYEPAVTIVRGEDARAMIHESVHPSEPTPALIEMVQRHKERTAESDTYRVKSHTNIQAWRVEDLVHWAGKDWDKLPRPIKDFYDLGYKGDVVVFVRKRSQIMREEIHFGKDLVALAGEMLVLWGNDLFTFPKDRFEELFEKNQAAPLYTAQTYHVTEDGSKKIDDTLELMDKAHCGVKTKQDLMAALMTMPDDVQISVLLHCKDDKTLHAPLETVQFRQSPPAWYPKGITLENRL